MTSFKPHIVISSGEPSGIGLDLCVLLSTKKFPAFITVVGDKNALADRAAQLNKSITFYENTSIEHKGDHSLSIHHIPACENIQTGLLNPKNNQYVIDVLNFALDGCLNKSFDALVTAPIHKSIINESQPFTGHTEYIAHYTDTKNEVMMLTSKTMKVALVTTHVPLSQVSRLITSEKLEQTLRTIHRDLIHRFKINSPKIFVAGLNPHAGENGILGLEEINILTPVINKLKLEGMLIEGPLPADTLFTEKYIQKADCFLAMYHDQGLAVFKHANFGLGVNVTLGLPIIRTSVDHGTAIDLAGVGNIDPNSFYSAIDLAIDLAQKSHV
ncbi:4-hydroxy-L-threonine phosphate dehydrogenase, NAD-dependent [Candidatus Methylopumilus planktonicus]|uniref:4-hydroxy-L-threonine phosphate dehydrogenase, NAD-dependent n=1 Tax=Candidatus Methylopumilus planktonicus TaxID=1581557 RepID=A0A0D6EVE7_9PROT|nr:4-hydroxythreonine-4-phosphate dehydrogenase PdxA [Candidatus Methylopumilus planktonicus]QDD06583.1 4-hydroxythreonine-4-phosphate dehydrogenase PdxA [Candidatus Methylopumilus planktonicus]QDD07918.1 4-hydroxythreonine-4-phosphate dehydrogenase PdxA [Candidatus Methylopumilus planktonicus]QDD09244.1 4-hydroxythreonine-4-phosphate dehydrogenase PdxA [Candidatus Methylopumilus planktonicus]CEZ19248.1 4-hydroxy-L-threonine phosphate dehydrogenase, NAD-dependent [Candidatus Methylopumilus plan